MTPEAQREELQQWHPGMAYNNPLNVMARACLAAWEERMPDLFEFAEGVFPTT